MLNRFHSLGSSPESSAATSSLRMVPKPSLPCFAAGLAVVLSRGFGKMQQMENAPVSYRFESVCDPTPEMREVVNVELRQFNRAANPNFFQAIAQPENDAKPLNLFGFDAEGQVCGGLFAETQFLWLKISIMAVREELRGKGIGAGLMKMAEAEAVQRGCKHAFVDTMDYQAPEFYIKSGYRVVGHLNNWDSHGHSKFYLTKELG